MAHEHILVKRIGPGLGNILLNPCTLFNLSINDMIVFGFNGLLVIFRTKIWSNFSKDAGFFFSFSFRKLIVLFRMP
jgi:hypothetical protein